MKIYADDSQNPNLFTGKSENPNAFSDSKANPTEKEKLKDLHGRKKIEYIWDYYRIPIIIVLVVILAGSYTIYAKMHQKKAVTSLTCANLYFTDEILYDMSEPFITDYLGINPKKYTINLDANLAVSDANNQDFSEYTYSSQMKILAYISAGEMDLVYMTQAAYDHFSASGFLMDIEDVLAENDPELLAVVKDDLRNNTYIVEDNTDELTKDPSIEYKAVLDESPFAIRVSDLELFRDFANGDDLYIGLATNSKRINTSIQYLRYLYGLELGNWEPEIPIE